MKYLFELFDNEIDYNCILNINNKEYKLHKKILSLKSDYFNKLFEYKNDKIIINDLNNKLIKDEYIELSLRYFYYDDEIYLKIIDKFGLDELLNIYLSLDYFLIKNIKNIVNALKNKFISCYKNIIKFAYSFYDNCTNTCYIFNFEKEHIKFSNLGIKLEDRHLIYLLISNNNFIDKKFNYVNYLTELIKYKTSYNLTMKEINILENKLNLRNSLYIYNKNHDNYNKLINNFISKMNDIIKINYKNLLFDGTYININYDYDLSDSDLSDSEKSDSDFD